MLMMLLAMVNNKGTEDTDTLGHRKQKRYDRLRVSRIRSLDKHEVLATQYREPCECIGPRLESGVLSPCNPLSLVFT